MRPRVELLPLVRSQLVRAARADVLIGQPESQRLDAKGQDYWLEDDAGKISLAQDVARFANGEDGGAIVIGLRTRKLADGEEISSISPVPIPKNGVRRHRRPSRQGYFRPPMDSALSRSASRVAP